MIAHKLSGFVGLTKRNMIDLYLELRNSFGLISEYN